MCKAIASKGFIQSNWAFFLSDGDKITLVGFVLGIENPENYEKESQFFEDMIDSGETDLVELFGRTAEK